MHEPQSQPEQPSIEDLTAELERKFGIETSGPHHPAIAPPPRDPDENPVEELISIARMKLPVIDAASKPEKKISKKKHRT